MEQQLTEFNQEQTQMFNQMSNEFDQFIEAKIAEYIRENEYKLVITIEYNENETQTLAVTD